MFIKGGREMNKKVIGAVLKGKHLLLLRKPQEIHIMRKKQMDLKKQSRMREEK